MRRGRALRVPEAYVLGHRGRARRRVLAAAAGAVLATLAAEGAAQVPVPSLDLRNFRPPTDPSSSLYLEPTRTPGAGNWNVGAWVSYANQPVLLEDGDGNELATPVEHQVSVDYVASLGLLERLAIGVTMPTAVYQKGDDTGPILGGDELPRSAIGDFGFSAKATLVPTDELGGFGLAALGRVTAPTGDERSYLGEGKVTGEMRLLGELKLPGVALRGTGGAKIRGSKRTYAGEEFGHDLPFGVGLAFKPQTLGWDSKGRWQWFGEVRGRVAITPKLGSGPQSPVLAGLSARYTVGDASLLAGVELPITSAVGNPTVRPVLAIGWAPRFYDEDSDGIADEADECPELEEDRDGFQDSDGCPEFDNDDDGVPDEDDQCGDQREDEDEFEDDDGCPDPDNDGDTIPDTHDACPNEAGPIGPGAIEQGCPVRDADGDGVLDDKDQCAAQPEDKDGFQDDDGCPDPDNDRDGVPDAEDACRDVKGALRNDPTLSGCPSPDRDGDTIDDKDDKCPAKPEDWDDFEDDDGCPDPDADKPAFQRKKPLVTIEAKGGDRILTWRKPPKFIGTDAAPEIDPKTEGTLRALATELNRNPTWIVAIGVKPAKDTPEAQQTALNRSFTLANELRGLTYRDEVAETVGWAAVSDLPGARRTGIGVLILTPQPPKVR